MSSSRQPPLPSIQRGSGLPVVLLHGFALSPNTYRRSVQLLADHVRVVLPMWLYVEGEWSEDAVTEGLAATLDAIGDEPVTVVGHSFGGALALLLAAAHTDRVRRLVLLNAMGASTAATMRSNALSVGSGQRLASLGAARDFFGSMSTRPRDVARAGWWGYRRDLAPEIERLRGASMLRDVVWTRGDTLLPVEDGQLLAERLDARFTLVADEDRRLDHDWAYRRPDRFVRTLLDIGIADR